MGFGGTPLIKVRWDMVRATGWTLAEVDALPVAELHNYWFILKGEADVRKTNAGRTAFERSHGTDKVIRK